MLKLLFSTFLSQVNEDPNMEMHAEELIERFNSGKDTDGVMHIEGLTKLFTFIDECTTVRPQTPTQSSTRRQHSYVCPTYISIDCCSPLI